MIKKMRLNFVAITMGAMLILLLVVFVTTNVFMKYQADRRVQDFLDNMIANDGALENIGMQGDKPAKVQEGPPPRDQGLIEGFSVKVDENDEVISSLFHEIDYTEDEIIEYANQALEQNDETGKVDDYKYQIVDKDYGKLIVFADQGVQDSMLEELMNVSIIIGSISTVILLIIAIFLSNLIIKPVDMAFKKQKRFIADSSHELKTPLAILSANADVLEMEIGENKRITEIKQQSERMNKLIHELLVLAKTEKDVPKKEFKKFNLSHAVENTILPFEVLAFEQKKKIETDIAEQVFYSGDEGSIKKMVDALVDNAVKYSKENSTISVRLHVKGSKKIIEVYNEGQGVSSKDKERLFEKFYRADESRARETGGYGIGLSIAKGVADMHNGKIQVESKQGEYIVFKVVLAD